MSQVCEPFDEDEFCPIMVYPIIKCPGKSRCPGYISGATLAKPYHTAIRCPDCVGREAEVCDRCFGHRIVPLEETFACDFCIFWKFDRCLCLAKQGRGFRSPVTKKNRPPVCEHFQPKTDEEYVRLL